MQVRALGRHGEAFISSLDWGWGWDAGLGRDPSAARPDSFPSKASGKRNKTPRSPTPSRSEPAAYSFGSGGTGRDQATPQTSACGAWPPRPGPPGARAGEPSKKGAARAAGEDGARRATAPPALAKGQAQRHLSAFQQPPPPRPAQPPQEPASWPVAGREPRWARALAAKIECHRASRLFGPAARGPQEEPG